MTRMSERVFVFDLMSEEDAHRLLERIRAAAPNPAGRSGQRRRKERSAGFAACHGWPDR